MELKEIKEFIKDEIKKGFDIPCVKSDFFEEGLNQIIDVDALKRLLEENKKEKNEQQKIKKFVQLVTEISIKHYDQKEYAKIVNLIYQEIFVDDEEPAEQLGKKVYSGQYILDWNDGDIKVRKANK